VVGIYSDLLRVLGLDLDLSGSIKQIIIKCFVRQVINFEGGGVAHNNVKSCCCKNRPNSCAKHNLMKGRGCLMSPLLQLAFHVL